MQWCTYAGEAVFGINSPLPRIKKISIKLDTLKFTTYENCDV